MSTIKRARYPRKPKEPRRGKLSEAAYRAKYENFIKTLKEWEKKCSAIDRDYDRAIKQREADKKAIASMKNQAKRIKAA